MLRTLNRVLPWAVAVLAPPNLDFSYIRSFDIEVEDLYAFSLRSLETKLERAGVAPGVVSEDRNGNQRACRGTVAPTMPE